MRAGKLRHNLDLFQPLEQDDSMGDAQVTYELYKTVRGSIEPATGKKGWVAKQVRPDVTHIITIRYRIFAVPLTSRWRARFQGRVFNLGPPMSTEERHRDLHFYAVEIVP